MNIDQIINEALHEDLPNGDLTSLSLGLESRFGRSRLIAKEDLVLSGSDVFNAVFKKLDSEIKMDWKFKDGDFIYAGQTACTLAGDVVKMLAAERIALNFLGRLSGIATLTRCFVQNTEGTATKILDTRKTTPLLRDLEKRAVVHGGGVNHRRDLSAAILIKENHIAIVGGVAEAVRRARKHSPDRHITVEVRNLEEVKEALKENPNRLLLDNMDVATMREAVKLVPSSVETEASGNMTMERIAEVAATGVTFISVGAITHSAPTADVSLLFERN